MKEVIETYNLMQHIAMPTRRGTKTIDHIITNIQENKLITTNVLPNPTISDHDAPEIITNRPGIKIQTRTKYVRNIKHFHIKDDAVDFKTLPLGLVYSFVLADHSPTKENYPKCRDIRNKLKSKNQRKKKQPSTKKYLPKTVKKYGK